MCETGKKELTKREAEQFLNRVKKGPKRRREKRVYHCPFCNWWHLTKQENGTGGEGEEIDEKYRAAFLKFMDND